MIGRCVKPAAIERRRESRRPCRPSCRWGRPGPRRPGRGSPPAWRAVPASASLSTSGPAGLVVHHAAVAVIGVFAEANVGDARAGPARPPSPPAPLAARCPLSQYESLPSAILLRGNAEQNHATQAQLAALPCLLGNQVDRKLAVPRHRSQSAGGFLAGPREQRQDKIAGREVRFTHQLANGGMLSESPEAHVLGKREGVIPPV